MKAKCEYCGRQKEVFELLGKVACHDCHAKDSPVIRSRIAKTTGVDDI